MLALELIERACWLHSVVICNWHYAVWTPNGYISQIALPRLVSLIERVRPEHVYLVLVTAPVDVVLERREKDRAIKKRKIDRASIEEEMTQSEHLYRLHCNVVASQATTTPISFDNSGPIDVGAIYALVNILYETS